MTLTEDQRRVLYGVGGWMVMDALATPDGLSRFLGGVMGGTKLGYGMATGPWEREWWQVSGTVTLGCPWNPPLVTITKTEIARYAKTLDPELHARIVEDRRNGSHNARALLAEALRIDQPAEPRQPRQYADYEQMDLW